MSIVAVLAGATVAGALIGLGAVYITLMFCRDHNEGLGPLL